MTTKIMALADALGNLIDFRLLPGQAHDLQAGTCLHSPTLRMDGQITANGCTGPQPLVCLGRQG